MPYKSQAQVAYFNTHKKEMQRQGVDVNEWNQASKGMKLPGHARDQGSGVRDRKAEVRERFRAAAAGRQKK